MKTDVFTINGEKKGTIALPIVFESEIRYDLIKKAYESEQSLLKPKYGTFSWAGKLTSSSGKIKHARAGYRAHYGRGISRVPRKTLTRRGTNFYWVGAFAPGTRGGRAAHPPKSWKNWEKKINKKEKQKALYSAIASVKPIIIEEKFEDLKKTKEINNALKKVLGKERSALIITSKKMKTKNVGLETASIKDLSVSNLVNKKIALWTEKALGELK
jgi:large subunit ribosomal protein L4e